MKNQYTHSNKNMKTKNFSMNKEKVKKNLSNVSSHSKLINHSKVENKEPNNISINSIIKPIQTTIVNKKKVDNEKTQTIPDRNISESRPIYSNNYTKDENLEYLMERLDFKEYSFNFIKNKITFNDLLLLKKEDFNELGIPLGPRNRILKFIEDYNKENINNSDKLSTIKRTLKNTSSNAEEDSIKKALSEEMQSDSKSSNYNKEENFPGIEYSYNYITSPKFAEKNNNNYQTQNFNVGSFNIVRNKFEVNIPESQHVNYNIKDMGENNKRNHNEDGNNFRVSHIKKRSIDANPVKTDIMDVINKQKLKENVEEDKNLKNNYSTNNQNTSTKYLSIKNIPKQPSEKLDKSSYDNKDNLERTKVFVKPMNNTNQTLGKSNSVVKINKDKIEQDFHSIENKVISFYKNLDELEQRSKERKERIESILKNPCSNPVKINETNPISTQIYHKKNIKYTNNSDKSTSTRKSVGSYFSSNI